MIRTKFIIIVIVPLIAFATVTYFFIDRWIESGLETAGEAIVGAKVEIDQLRVTLSPLAIEFRRLQVANPKDGWKNIFETGKVRAAMDFGQLLRGKFIVETVEMNDLILGTKRTTDGALPKKRVEPSEQSTPSIAQQAGAIVETESKKAPMFDLDKLKKGLKIDSLLNVQNLRSVQHIDTLKQQVQRASQEWQAAMSDVEQSKQKLSDIESSIKSINTNELKSLDKIVEAATKVNNASKSIGEINDKFKNRRSSINNQLATLAASVNLIDDLAKQDFESVKGMARLPDMNMQGLAHLLVGKQILDEVNSYLGWVDFARNTVPRYLPKPDYETPERFKGQNIQFPTEHSFPKLWVKKVLVSGGEDKNQDPNYFYAKGEVHDISSNQQLTGQPLTVALSGTKAGTTTLSLQALFDRRRDEPLDNYKMKLAGLAVGDFDLGRSDFLPSKITQSVAGADAVVNMPGHIFDGNLGVNFRGLTLHFDRPPANDVERIVRDVLQGVQGFNVDLRLWNAKGSMDMAFSTDLDDLIAARTKKVIGDEIARIQNEIRGKVNQKIAEKRQEFEKLYNQKREEVLAQLRSYENFVNEKVAFVEGKKKELDARVEQEKKKQAEGAKKKLEDAVKGLFKK
jgi:uncharacterized protein (TIGR03545 family)